MKTKKSRLLPWLKKSCSYIGVVGAVSLVGLAVALGSYSATLKSLQKEEISQNFSLRDSLQAASSIKSEKGEPPSNPQTSSEYMTVITNTGRLPITLVSFLVDDDNGAETAVEAAWVRLEDEGNSVRRGPLLLGPGEAVAVRLESASGVISAPLTVQQSDGRSLKAKVLADRDVPSVPGVVQKFEALESSGGGRKQ